MKKLFVLLVVVVFASCSQDPIEDLNQVVSETSLSVLEGGLLSYKDDASFIKEYSKLSELESTKDIQDWITKKGHSSFLNISDTNEELQDSIISNNRIIYSDALKSILSTESKFKINGKVIWLYESNLFVLTHKYLDKSILELKTNKNNLEVYGRISNLNTKQKSSNANSRSVIPNENRIKTFVTNFPDSKRNILDLYNETIVFNDQIVSSKMFLRTIFQYRSCSFWRCTWKNSTENCLINNYTVNGSGDWISNYIPNDMFPGSKTFLLATWTGGTPPQTIGYTNYIVSGTIRWQTISNLYSYETPISWY